MIPRLHLVTDDGVLSDPGFPDALRAISSAGGSRIAVHLRGPGLGTRRLLELGRSAREVTRDTDTPLLVNDRVDVALVLGADGAHLARRSLPVPAARGVLGPTALLGTSVHGPSEARESSGGEDDGGTGGGADFVFAGTIYATPSHPGVSPAGPERIREAVGPIPVLGIGGIDSRRVAAVMGAGAHGAAVIRAVWGSSDPAEATLGLLEAIESSLPQSGH